MDTKFNIKSDGQVEVLEYTEKKTITSPLILLQKTTADIKTIKAQIAALDSMLTEKIKLRREIRKNAAAMAEIKKSNAPIIAVNESKLYYTVTDDEYDTIEMDKDRGDMYFETVEDAESLGFKPGAKK
jgi:hypothetical protein